MDSSQILEIKNWFWLITTIGATIVAITYFSYTFASNLINNMEVGLSMPKRAEVYMIVMLAASGFLVSNMILIIVKFIGISPIGNNRTMPMGENIATTYFFILTFIVVFQLSFFMIKIKGIWDNNINIFGHRFKLTPRKNKIFSFINMSIFIMNIFILAYIYFHILMIDGRYNNFDIIFTIICSVFIYAYTVMIYGTGETIGKLLKLKIVTMILKDDYSMNCKILKIKGDFIYYIYDGKLACINKGKVLEIKNI